MAVGAWYRERLLYSSHYLESSASLWRWSPLPRPVLHSVGCLVTLKAKLDANELVSTLMLNAIALRLLRVHADLLHQSAECGIQLIGCVPEIWGITPFHPSRCRF